MSSSKLEILKLIEEGKISVEEGLQLIEAAEQTESIESDIEREERYHNSEDVGEGHKNFDIRLVSCRLNIERSRVEDVTVELLDPKTRELVEKPDWLIFHEEKDFISIKENRNGSIMDILNFFKESLENSFKSIFINVKLPMDMHIGEGKFSSVSGNVSALGLQGTKLLIKSVSGKVYMTGIKAKMIEAKSTSGAVIAEDVIVLDANLKSTSGKLKITGRQEQVKGKTVSGEIEFDGTDTLVAADLSTVSGKIDIKISNPEQYNLDFNSLSGGIDSGGFGVVQKETSGKKYVDVKNRSDQKIIRAHSVSGKIIFDRK